MKSSIFSLIGFLVLGVSVQAAPIALDIAGKWIPDGKCQCAEGIDHRPCQRAETAISAFEPLGTTGVTGKVYEGDTVIYKNWSYRVKDTDKLEFMISKDQQGIHVLAENLTQPQGVLHEILALKPDQDGGTVDGKEEVTTSVDADHLVYLRTSRLKDMSDGGILRHHFVSTRNHYSIQKITLNRMKIETEMNMQVQFTERDQPVVWSYQRLVCYFVRK